MTKKEQIKEMAQIICRRSKDNICLFDKNSCDCCWANDAEIIYNAGYRKVPENVILLDFNTEAGTASYTVMPRDEFMRNVSSRKAVEKNAVKDFAEKLKKKLFDFFQNNEEIDGKISTGILYAEIIGVDAEDGTVVTLGLINELLKEYEK